MTLSAHWYEPLDNSTENIEAAERIREFQVSIISTRLSLKHTYIMNNAQVEPIKLLRLSAKTRYINKKTVLTTVMTDDFRCFKIGLYGHPIFSKEGDYPTVMKDRIAARSLEQGYSTSRLPSFTPEEVEYIRGTYDFFGLNHYTTMLVRTATTDDVFEDPSFDDDHQTVASQDKDWAGASSSWLKVDVFSIFQHHHTIFIR